MNGIIDTTGLLVDTGLNEEQRNYCDIILASGESLMNIINKTPEHELQGLRALIEVDRRLLGMQNELIESKKLLAHQATHVPMTDLLNRSGIMKNLEATLSRAHKNYMIVAVGMTDINHFKHVNDTYGHQVGDDISVGLTQRLKQIIFIQDHVRCFGGEEFLVFSL